MGTTTFQVSAESKVTSFALSPNASRMMAVVDSGLREWKSQKQTVAIGVQATRATAPISVVAASADGQWMMFADSRGTITAWNVSLPGKAFYFTEHKDLVYSIDISNDSKRLASASRDKTVRIFSVVSGSRVSPPLLHTHSIAGVQFSPDGSRIATVCEESRVGVYDVSSGLKVFEIKLETHIPAVLSASATPLAWSHNGQQLYIASSNQFTCVDISTSSKTQWSLENEDDVNVSIVTCGNFIARSSGSSVTFWDYTSHQQISRTINHPYPIHCIAISRNRKFLACGHDWGVTFHALDEHLPRSYLQALLPSRVPLVQLSDAVLKSLVVDDPKTTEAILSGEIVQCSDPRQDVFAIRALVRAYLGEQSAAMEDAENVTGVPFYDSLFLTALCPKSLQIAPSAIGQVAKCIAHVVAGEQDVALDHFDFAFRDGDSNDSTFLFAVKSILMFVCGNHRQAVSRFQALINAADGETKNVYLYILGKMYLEQGDHASATETLGVEDHLISSEGAGSLVMISLIFNWNFKNIQFTAWRRLCESTDIAGKDVGERLQKIVGMLTEDKQEVTLGNIVQETVTCSGEVTLLMWTGKPSMRNSCLPSSPMAYRNDSFEPPVLQGDELEKRVAKLRAVFPLEDALVIYGRVTRLQPIRFVQSRLFLPCVVFGIESLKKEGNIYRAEVDGLEDVEFTTADSVPLDKPHQLVFANLWVHKACSGAVTREDKSAPADVEANKMDAAGNEADLTADLDLVHISISEEVPTMPPLPLPSNKYKEALQLIAHLGQPFSALLLLKQPNGAYRRVAADNEIVVRGAGNNVPKDISVKVLEVV